MFGRCKIVGYSDVVSPLGGARGAISQQRPSDIGAVTAPAIQPGPPFQRFYVSGLAWGGPAQIAHVNAPFRFACIGATSHYGSAYIGHADDTQKQWLVSVGSPLIGEFEPPMVIRPSFSFGAPIEILFFKDIPSSFPIKRAPLRRGVTWKNGAVQLLAPDDCGINTAFVGGQVQLATCIEGRRQITVGIRNGDTSDRLVSAQWFQDPQGKNSSLATAMPPTGFGTLGTPYEQRRIDRIPAQSTSGVSITYDVPAGMTEFYLYDVTTQLFPIFPNGSDSSIILTAED